MNLMEYNTTLEDGMRVKHGAKARLIIKAGEKTLEDELTNIDSLGGALTRAGFMYNRLSMSGGVEWWYPATGESIPRPKTRILLRQIDVLTGDELCDCSKCIPN